MSRRWFAGCLCLLGLAACDRQPAITVGSKAFTEGVILGEVLRQRLELAGLAARHERQLGGTRVVWNALVAGDIDLYVEYTGTLAAEIFAGEVAPERAALSEALAQRGVELGPALGFANTYALGMSEARADELRIDAISDLQQHPQLRLGFSNEFMDREDGWPGLRERYGLAALSVTGLEHDLAYRGLAGGDIDVTDLYSTDAEIRYYGLRVLADDRAYFPDYRAIVLVRREAVESEPLRAVLQSLADTINTASMVQMNAGVKLDGRSEAEVAADFVEERFGRRPEVVASSRSARLADRTLEHAAMVAVSLFAAIFVAIPTGIVAARRPRFGALLLGISGVLQTVPSLALLVVLIPVLGIGAPPAILALFLYSLLPIMRNTVAGLGSIDPALLESADALGLPRRARLRLVELPLAATAIIAGIKTAAVINVGTATLGALVGAGGYGQPILTGIRLDDTALILEGAVPAALMALLAQAFFAALEHRLVPRGLRV